MELNFSRKKPDLDEVSEIKSMTEHICQCPMITQFSMIKSFNLFLIEIGFYMEWWGGGTIYIWVRCIDIANPTYYINISTRDVLARAAKTWIKLKRVVNTFKHLLFSEWAL